MLSLCSLCPLWFILFISACVPAATPPPVLEATADAAVVVTDSSYQNDAFRLIYPRGWRVITSPAGAPPGVTLVAPGDCALIVVSTASLDAPAVPEACHQEDILTDTRSIDFGGATVHLAGSAPLSQWDAFLIAFERIAGSLTI